MAMARVLNDEDFSDVVLRKQISQVFLFFLPGLASGFKQIATEDEKIGHKVPRVSNHNFFYIIFIMVLLHNTCF